MKPMVWRESLIAGAVRHAYDEDDDELAIARANGGEDDEEANEESEFVRSIRPVTLEPDRNDEYENFFYPKDRQFLIPVLESLSDVTTNINLFFRFMRLCMADANVISGMDEEQATRRLEQHFYNTFETKRDEKSVKHMVVGFLQSVRLTSSSFHNIYRSQRYTDGIDIVLNGTNDDARSDNMPAPFFGSADTAVIRDNMLANDHSESTYVNAHRYGRWQSPFGQNLVAAAKEITIFLFGSSAISDRTIHRGLSINTKFSDIEDIWYKHTKFKLPQQMVTDMTVTNHLAEQFLQVEMMKMPSKRAKSVAAEIRKHALDNVVAFGNDRSSTNSRIENSLNGNDIKIAPEAELLNLVLRSSIRFTLESDIAHFVSQTETAERPSLSRTNSWFTVYIGQVLRAKLSDSKKGMPSYSNTQSIVITNIPRYSMGATTLKRISDIRAQHGFTVEKTKGNAEGMYIRPNGTMSVRPDIEAFKKSTLAEDYEKVSEEILEILNRNDIPIAAFQLNPRPAAWPHIDTHDIERLAELMKELHDFQGCIIGYDWDFGISMTAGDLPGAAATRVDVGTVTPDALTIADYLGYNLSKDTEKPMKRNFASTMFTLARYQDVTRVGENSEKKYGAREDAAKFAESDIVENIINLYVKLAYVDKKVPQLAEIAKTAMKVLGYEKLPTEKGHDYEPSYLQYFSEDGTFKQSEVATLRRIPVNLLKAAMHQASGMQGSSLWAETYESLKTADYSPKSYEIEAEIDNHPNYFNASASTTADFARLYNYFGGQVFKQILDAINSIPAADYFNERGGRVKADFGIDPRNGQPSIADIPRLNNREIMQEVLPYANMLGKYAPNAETIFAQADEQVESIRPDESFSAGDIKLPGMVIDDKQPRAVFPHQESVQSYLRKKVPPSFAILALDPGGGKTGQGVIDMACMVKDMLEVGTVVKPLVICPNGLINQWCEDMKYFVGANWNAFPLSAAVMARWGEKRLLETAANAPPNTIFIASMTFIQGRNKRVCIGNAQVNFSANLEFIRRLGCNYIAIDESHNLKSFGSARHRAVKILTTSTAVKWLRLLTGTIMPDRAKDIEGQIALKTPHVFRAGEIANIRADADVQIGNRVISTYTPLNGKRAVDKLSHYTAYIVKKRKEWAFMLPAPIEEFHSLEMVDHDGEDGTSKEEIEQQKLHAQLYKLVLDKTLEELKPLLAQKKKAEDASDHEYDNEGGGDGEHGQQEEEGGGGTRADTTDNDADFAGEKIKQALWEKNLARFERLIIAPQYDEAYEQVFGSMAEGFKSRKAKYIANLVHVHFNTPAWRRGEQYGEYDLVSHDGDLYVVRKYHESASYMPLPRDVLNIPPTDAPDYWKKEPRGKCIIITRYNHSASAIYDALPPNYQEKAVKFTGDEPDKVKAFNDFKTDDRVQILIANEQGMSEGHNLQMASRIIRAESPWGPGALNQTNARIFRPDPKGALNGELNRDVIYLDWVLADKTMEVPKQARVISKTFGIARFSEADNPRYQDLLKNRYVPTEREDASLSLGIDMLSNIKGERDEPFNDMILAYKQLNTIENEEFRDMRASQVAELLPIEGAENVAGAAIMEVRPFVANQPIADPNRWKLTNVETLMRDKAIADNPKERLLHKPVVTEWGTGRIVGFNAGKGANKGVSSLIINLKNPPIGMSSRQTVRPNMAYMAMENISPEQLAKYFDVSLEQTDTAEKNAERKANTADKRKERAQKEQDEKERQDKEIRDAQMKKKVSIIKKEKKDGDQRKENVAKGKPVNDGIYKVEDGGVLKIIPAGTKIAVNEEDPTMGRIVDEASDLDVSLFPAYYHGFATLEAEFDEASVNLKSLGFTWTPAYAFVTVSNKKKFHAIYEYLDANFDLPDKTVDLISAVNAAFEPGQKNTHKLWYSLELAPISELPAFFSVGKRITSNRRAVRVFPIFMEEHVMLCIDIRTNPAIAKHIGKTIPGAAVKWQRSEGQWFYFGRNKTDLKEMIAKVGRNGYKVVNKAAALKELAELNFKYKKSK